MADLPVISVTELNWRVKDVVDQQFPYVCVEGEMSNVKRAASGHVYFTLKDDRSEMRGVIWSRTASQLKFKLADGLAVLATGPVEVYAARGTYSLSVEHLVPRGMGELELAFRQLHQKLSAEGLFDPISKKPLPRFPKRIAIITSPTGAAIRDMLQVIVRRWRGTDIIIMPVPVQGPNASVRIARGITVAPRLKDVDLIITGRGGGSLEDLWAFNEERVARAIHECPIPVISAVGHEVDVSISDLVADARAVTPTEAGQMAVPDQREILVGLENVASRLRQSLFDRVRSARMRLDHVHNHRVFQRPLSPIRDRAEQLDRLHVRLERSARQLCERNRNRIQQYSRQLDALSPLKVLGRGYSITESSGRVVRSTGDIAPDQILTTRVSDGLIESQVIRIDTNEEQDSK